MTRKVQTMNSISPLLVVPLAGGGEVVVEVDRREVTGDGVELVSDKPDRLVGRATETLETSLARVTPAVADVIRSVSSASSELSEVVVEFSLKLGGEAGVVLAKGSAEAAFRIQAKWTRS